jgi:hypothetical protein
MYIRKDALTWMEEKPAFLVTPLKHLSTVFSGPSAWVDTGCDAKGVGRPVREAQHSTDGFYTIDVSVKELWVEGVHFVPIDRPRYVRLEIMPGTDAHRSVEARLPERTDLIEFSGPLVWDKDVDRDHRGHMEVHPIHAIRFVN